MSGIEAFCEGGERMLGFVSPRSGRPLRRDGERLISDAEEAFPLIDGIPRFVNGENYAAPFGLEWKLHSRTQLDSYTGTSISRDRLERCLGAKLETLRAKKVLEAGCGSGRFTELMVEAGALVHAIDLSVAVEANCDNVGSRANYRVAQADIRSIPFPRDAFDLVLCIGVLQHTPSPEESVAHLWAMVRPGGCLVIDHYSYSLSLLTKLAPVYRLFLRRLEPVTAKTATDRLSAVFFPLHWATRRFRLGQMLLSRVSPCLVYFDAFPMLSREQHYEFCRLDTYDHLTDYYKHLRTVGQIRRLLLSLGAEDITVCRGGNGLEARCRKPRASAGVPGDDANRLGRAEAR